MTTRPGLADSLLALLREEPGAILALNDCPIEAVEEAAVREGVVALVAARVSAQRDGARLAAALGTHARREVLRDVVRQRELQTLLEAFVAAAVPVLVFKGEHLAHLCYDRPDLRPRLDTDLLVRPQHRADAAHVLASCGYDLVPQLEADLISYQATYVKRPELGQAPAIDLHWRVSNPHEFGDVVTVDELFASAVPIAALGPHALAPGLPEALLLSIVHPVAHHAGGDRLVWDYDTARLLARMTERDWPAFLRLGMGKRISRLLDSRLDRASRMFGVDIPDHVRATLRAHSREDGRLHVSGGRTRAGELVASLRSLPRWADRMSLLRQHILPPRDYIRRVYAPASRAPIALLYFRRAVGGAFRYWRR